MLSFSAIFAGCGLSGKSAENDFKVKREVFDFNKYPALTAVGKINFIGQKWCSLTLVSEDIAVTAGHCFLENNVKFDITKDIEPHFTSVIFRANGNRRIENVSIKRVLKAEMNPDYAIVKLNKKIPESLIKPLKFSALTFEEIRSKEERLGCAGFNGDKELGEGGWQMTISRNVKIVPTENPSRRIDVNCFSTYGGSGGLFFAETENPQTNSSEYELVGVVWGMSDEKYDERGNLVKDENIVTSTTPVSFFYQELSEIIKQNSEEKWQKMN